MATLPGAIRSALGLVGLVPVYWLSEVESLNGKQWRIVIIIIILIIIIAFKGAIREFLQSPHCAANCLQHVHSCGPGAIACTSRATHRAHITCNMSCYVPRGTKGQFTYRVWITFILALFRWPRKAINPVVILQSLVWPRPGKRSPDLPLSRLTLHN